jgi:hypothetical protein
VGWVVLGAYSEWCKYLGLANDSRRAALAVDLHFLALSHGTICAIRVYLWPCHTDCCTNMSSVEGLVGVVLPLLAEACAAPEILRSGDEIRLDLGRVAHFCGSTHAYRDLFLRPILVRMLQPNVSEAVCH